MLTEERPKAEGGPPRRRRKRSPADGERQRARRRDAGRVEPTERDARALRFIAEMYAVRLDTLGLLLGALGPAAPEHERPSPGRLPGGALVRADQDQAEVDGEEEEVDGEEEETAQIARVTHRRAQAVAERWERAGWGERVRMLNRQWFLPSKRGYELAGIVPRAKVDEELPPGMLAMEVWKPNLWLLPHVHAVALVRLAVEPTLGLGQRWVSERELRREARDVPDHGVRKVFDACLESEELVTSEFGTYHPRTAIEVELSMKTPGEFRATVQRRVPLGIIGLHYYAPGPMVPILRTRLEQMSPTVSQWAVDPLPEFPGVPYMSAMGGRLEA